MKAKITDSKHLEILGNDRLLSNRENLINLLKQWRRKLGYFTIFSALPAILTSQVQGAHAEEANKPEISAAGHNVRLLAKLKKSSSNFSLLRGFAGGGDNCPGTAIPGGTYKAAAPYTDSGDTTGANNTVKRAHWIHYIYYNYAAEGPDQIYSFTLTGRGPNPQIEVSTTSAAYQPMIYILDSRSGGCPVGTENNAFNELVLSDSRWSNDRTAILNNYQMNLLPLNVPLFLFVDSRVANESGHYTLRMQDVTLAPALPRTRFDFDGDGQADISVFRPSDRVWYMYRSTLGISTIPFGLSTDKIAPADFDGDGKADIAVFRDGVWHINGSFMYFSPTKFGLAGDIPVPADFTGDGRAELAIFRNGSWWMLNLANNQVSVVQFGLPTDIPVAADYDGDGRVDQAVYRNGEWHLNRSSLGYAVIQFGLATDKPVIGDFDGDGKSDPAVYRDGVWYALGSQVGFTTFPFGLATDIPVPADYDGDGRTDAAVYRDGIWYLLQSANGFTFAPFGLTGDKPIPAAFVP